MRYRVNHTTTYQYSEPASLSQNELCLQPKQTDWQTLENWHLTITPEPQYQRHREDFFGNGVHVFMIQHPHNELVVSATSTVVTSPHPLPAPDGTMPWEDVVRRLAEHGTREDLDARQYCFASPFTSLTPAIESYSRHSFPPGRPVLAGALELMHRFFTEFSYEKDATTIETPVDLVLENRRGVCQDFAHLMISCLRALGLAARYVSGYLETQPPPGNPKLQGADASHAWLSLYLPDFGWVDLDPTNDLVLGDQHITVAWGRDYADVTPVKGVVTGGGNHTMAVRVEVVREQVRR